MEVIFFSFTLLLSHLQNNGATVDGNTLTSPDPVSNSMLLELKSGGRKGVGEGTDRCSLQRIFVFGPYRSIGGLSQAWSSGSGSNGIKTRLTIKQNKY